MSLDLDDATERVATDIVDSAFKVHKALGPGLLESVYEACLSHELRLRGLKVETQIAVPIEYEGLVVDAALRLDMLVNNSLMLRKVDISPFQGSLPLAIELVGVLPRPGICDAFSVGIAYFHEVETYYIRGQLPRT